MPQKQYLSHFDNLKNRWTDRRVELQKSLLQKNKDALEWITKHAVIGSVGGFALLTTPAVNVHLPNHIASAQEQFAQDIDTKMFLIADLSHSLPDTVQPLTLLQEETIAQTLTRHFGFRVTPYLQHKRLNTSYGYIGQEQHLARFPGDTMTNHFDTEED